MVFKVRALAPTPRDILTPSLPAPLCPLFPFLLCQITMVFIVWALGMYVLYVISVVCGDGLLSWLMHRLAGVRSKATRSGFSWVNFRDGLLKW